MIGESMYWKEELLRVAARLRRRTLQKTWTERSKARLEQQVMLGCFSVRKLVESAKLSEVVATQRIELTTYPWSGRRVTKMNWDDIDKNYNLQSAGTEFRDLMFVCNQVIHSFVFMPLLLEHGPLFGVLFSSDRERLRCLYQLEIEKLTGVFEQVGRDDPNSMTGTFNEATQDVDFMLS